MLARLTRWLLCRALALHAWEWTNRGSATGPHRRYQCLRCGLAGGIDDVLALSAGRRPARRPPGG